MLKKLNAMLLGLALTLSLSAQQLALGAPTTLPLPAINGPYLGDSQNNLYTLSSSYLAGSGYGAVDLGSISQTVGQANCTQIGPTKSSLLHRATTSASTGYVCLPTATAGQVIYIANATGQLVDIYSNATSYAPGTADKINGTAGSTAYTGLTAANSLAVCVSPVNGNWYCTATSNGASGPGAFTTLTASGQITSTAGLPTIASGGCGATTNGAVVAGSTNQSGSITIGSATTSTCTVNFSATLASAPLNCTLQPQNSAAATVGTTGAYISAITTAHFVITGTLANANYGFTCL